MALAADGGHPDPGILLLARLLRRLAPGAAARRPDPGPARQLRRAHLSPRRQAGHFPHRVGRRRAGAPGLSLQLPRYGQVGFASRIHNRRAGWGADSRAHRPGARILAGMHSSAARARRRAWLPVVSGSLFVILGVIGLQHVHARQPAFGDAAHGQLRPGSASSSPTPSPTPTPTPKVCARNAPGFPCTMRNRIKEIRGYMRHLPGSIGIVIYNREERGDLA